MSLAAALSLASLLPLAASSAAVAPDQAAAAQEPVGRVIVLGLDGVDARMAAEWMDSGELPNFARLRAEGSFAALMPANPAQSPVSWATLNSGQNPGKTGIFDFIGVTRDGVRRQVSATFGFTATDKISAAEAGLPFAAASQVWMLIGGGVLAGALLWYLTRRAARGIPGAVLGLAVAGGCAWWGFGWLGAYPEGDAFTTYLKGNMARDFWEELDDAGVPFRGQGTVVSYPPQELAHGKLLAGLGAPDATGGLNSSQIWTTAEKRVRKQGEYRSAPAWSAEDAPAADAKSGAPAGTVRVFRLLEKESGVWESKIAGPANVVLQQALVARNEAVQAKLQSGSTPELQKEKAELAARLSAPPGLSQLSTWLPLRVEWTPGAEAAGITLGAETQTVEIGSWSDYFHLEFPWSARFSTYANVRLWVEEIDGALEIYANPLQIDPERPWPGSRISTPASFASDLKQTHGPYETLGWACQTHAVKDAELSDRAFLADIEHILTWRTTLLEDAMKDSSWKSLFHFYGEPDRVCHMLMRHYDPLHPQFDEALANEEIVLFGKRVKMRDVPKAVYVEMDNVVGRLLDEWMQPDDVLLVVSDHGFDSFRREVNLNHWLVEEGFSTLMNRNRIDAAIDSATIRGMMARGDAFAWMDWERSQAYSAAIGKIYLNLRGREPYGIVDPAEADAILDRITERLYELRDPDSGEKIVAKVYRKTEIYRGGWVEAQPVPVGAADLPAYGGAAELTIDFALGYRAAWTSTTGKVALVDAVEDGETIARVGPVVTDNLSPWSGDHCGVDLSAVQGIFFSNRKTALPDGWDHYDAVHLAPTVLSLLGVKIPAEYDSGPLHVQ
jgi:predicted AlkP superfamily phosphohydrolase/phosphomutase